MKVSHCYREANFCVDALVKFGANSGSDVIFKEDYPVFISRLVSNDVLGVSIPKFSLL